jgi:hypothetical protein
VSRAAPPPDREALRRRARRFALGGLAACLPRLVLVWFVLPPAFDLLLVAVTLLFVGGLLLLAIAIFQAAALRTGRVLPIGVAGAVGVVLAGIVVRAAPAGGSPVAYDGGVLAPGIAVLYQYAYLLLGAMSQLGLMLVVGTVGVALSRRRSNRA